MDQNSAPWDQGNPVHIPEENAPDILLSAQPVPADLPPLVAKKPIPWTLIAAAAFVLIAGVFIPVGIARMQVKSGTAKELATNVSVPTAAPTIPAHEQLLVVVSSPQEGEITADRSTTVTGKTRPGASIVVFSETADTVADADTEGNFSANLALADGINTITVTAFSPEGEEKTATVNVIRDTTN
jgi:hypothetical protein